MNEQRRRKLGKLDPAAAARIPNDVRGARGNDCYKNGTVRPSILRDIIRRVVEAADPQRIILFGSAARGQMGPNSDIDLLVVKGGKFNRWRVTTAIYRGLCGAGAAVDVMVVTPEEVERYRDTHCLVICPALREGQLVYGE